jgi:hypothetical protein
LQSRGSRNTPAIDKNTFLSNLLFQSVRIPSSVEVLGGHGFELPADVSVVIFETGSELVQIDRMAFYGHALLEAICIPALKFSVCNVSVTAILSQVLRLNRILS